MSRFVVAGGAVLVGLLAPATASAATTFTVDPAAAAGCAATNVCKTITEANAKAADGDTISIKAGSFVEPTLVVTKANLTFVAAETGKVAIATSTATAGAPTFQLGDGTAAAGKGTTLRGLVVSGPATGGPSISVQTTGTLLDTVSVQRVGSTDAPTIQYDDSGSGITGGSNAIKGSLIFLLQNPAEAGTAPAVDGGAETSLAIEDSTIVSGEKGGPGVRFDGNDRGTAAPMAAIPNTITRGTVLAQKAAANAVEVVSAAASAAPKATVLDSVALVPGTTGAGVAASSVAGTLGATAGDVSVTARHVTIAGGGKPFALAASALPMVGLSPAAVGSIAVTADRSILHGAGASTVTAAAGNPLQPGGTARLVIKDSDTTDAAAGTGTATTATSGAITKTADDALFRNLAAKDLHLKATAPVVDKGGAQVAGESDKDFEGQARVTGAASDLGADEFANTLPVAVLKADRTQVKAGEAIAFDATGSSDVDGPIANYAINFGDGSAAETPATGKASHVFTKPGAFKVILGVADAAGGTGLAAVDVTVADGAAPVVAITAPKAAAKVTAFAKKVTKKKLKPLKGRARTQTITVTSLKKILFSGTASDEAGVKSVELSLRRVSVAKKQVKAGTTRKTTTAQKKAAKAAQAGQCTFLDTKTAKFLGRPCGKPIFFTVAVKNGKWSYQLKKGTAFKLGAYELSARATDNSGVVSAPVKAAFTLR